MTRLGRTLAVILGLAFPSIALPVNAATHDLVIENGRVMDPEIGFDQVSNIGIRDGKIVKITADELSGAETIDAKNHVVAPGFIDCEGGPAQTPRNGGSRISTIG